MYARHVHTAYVHCTPRGSGTRPAPAAALFLARCLSRCPLPSACHALVTLLIPWLCLTRCTLQQRWRWHFHARAYKIISEATDPEFCAAFKPRGTIRCAALLGEREKSMSRQENIRLTS